MSECSVCTDKFTLSVRTKITCNQCEYSACKSCVTRYLLSQVVDAHCMNCRTGWNREFMDQHMTKAFRTGPWRDHRKKMIMIREKAELPNFQVYAAAKKRMNELRPMVIEAREHESAMQLISTTNSSAIYSLKNLMIRDSTNDDENYKKLLQYNKDNYEQIVKTAMASIKLSRIEDEYNNNELVYNGQKKKEVEKREFIMKCVKEDCRGFLSTAYKCELCNTYVCKDCMVPKSEAEDTIHECKKEDVETVKMIRKDTRPCPKCGIRISKIDGCDQMWCTVNDCGTPFSWSTGKIVGGTVHNPHYYEWMRRQNNNGVIPRNPGDNPCGNAINIHELSTIFRYLGFVYVETTHKLNHFTTIMNFHRSLRDLEFVRVPHYTVVHNETLFKELHIEYLLGNIDETRWKQSIYLKETNREKKQCIAQVLTTFMNAGNDLMRTVHVILNRMQNDKVLNPKYTLSAEALEPLNNIIKQIDNLRIYINDTLLEVANNLSTPVPQFNNEYTWVTPSSYDRICMMKPPV